MNTHPACIYTLQRCPIEGGASFINGRWPLGRCRVSYVGKPFCFSVNVETQTGPSITLTRKPKGSKAALSTTAHSPPRFVLTTDARGVYVLSQTSPDGSVREYEIVCVDEDATSALRRPHSPSYSPEQALTALETIFDPSRTTREAIIAALEV